MALFYNAVEGDVTKVMTLGELRAIPALSQLIDVQGRSVRQRLVTDGLLEQPLGPHSGQYKMSETGRDYALGLFQ